MSWVGLIEKEDVSSAGLSAGSFCVGGGVIAPARGLRATIPPLRPRSFVLLAFLD